MAFVDYNLACPRCNSSDAYAIDDNGWGKCFSCDSNIPPSQNNLRSADDRVVPLTSRKVNKAPVDTSADIVYRDMHDRKLSSKVCELYGVGFRGKDVYFPYNKGHAAKIRLNGEKRFKTEGDWSDSTTLFGQERFPAKGKMIIVCEGEYDAMAAHQMMSYRTPAVSVRSGATSALKDCKNNYEYLDSFDTVVFCFDNDAPGHQAQVLCAELFSHKAKCFVGVQGLKDACDYLKENRTSEFVESVHKAETYTPDGIVAGISLYESVMKPLQKSAATYPFEGLNKLTYGIRKEELVTVTAGSGLGKSQFLREIIFHLLNITDSRIGLMFLEETTTKTGLSLMSLAANKPLHLPDTKATQKEKDEAFEETLGTDRLFLFDHFGSSEIDNIVNKVRYFAKVVGCDYVFLDHISIVVSDQSNGDERKAIDEIMTKLRKLVQETGVSLIAVSHLKRPDSKGHEEGAVTSLAQLRGSASIAQLSDMVVGLERNGQADDIIERNTTRVRVLKNRFSGVTGPACALLYSHDTGRMMETNEEAL